MDKYVPLWPHGFQDAQNAGYIDKNDSPNGNLCLECGAIVASRWLHDIYHGTGDDAED
jgi:hypothetical protein